MNKIVSAGLVGIVPGMKLRILGSTASEIEGVRRAVDLPALRGFEQEDLRAMRRRKKYTTTASLPTGQLSMHTFETMVNYLRVVIHSCAIIHNLVSP